LFCFFLFCFVFRFVRKDAPGLTRIRVLRPRTIHDLERLLFRTRFSRPRPATAVRARFPVRIIETYVTPNAPIRIYIGSVLPFGISFSFLPAAKSNDPIENPFRKKQQQNKTP